MTILVLFQVYDCNGDGYICTEDVEKWIITTMGYTFDEKTRAVFCSRTIADADRDGDGKISYQDFKQVLYSFEF